VRWPVDPNLDRPARHATKSGKPNRDLTKKRGDHVLSIVLDLANTAAASHLLTFVHPAVHQEIRGSFGIAVARIFDFPIPDPPM
jgi:hypothetical protein